MWKTQKNKRKYNIPLREIEQGDSSIGVVKSNRFYSRAYWENYIDSIIDSIEKDKCTIIDLLMYGELDHAKVIMKLFAGKEPTYEMRIYKIAEKSPFGDDDE